MIWKSTLGEAKISMGYHISECEDFLSVCRELEQWNDSPDRLARFHVVILFVNNNDYCDLVLCIDILKTG